MTIKKLLITILLLPLTASAIDMTKCVGCHGANFEKSAMNTSRIVKDLTQKEIYTALIGYKDESKGGAMQSVMSQQMANFNHEEIKQLSYAIPDHNISIKPDESNLTTEQTDIEVNINICITCHGEHLEKSAMGVSRIVNQMSKEDIMASIYGYKYGTYGGDMKALMAGIAIKLSDEEIKSIADTFGIKPSLPKESKPK